MWKLSPLFYFSLNAILGCPLVVKALKCKTMTFLCTLNKTSQKTEKNEDNQIHLVKVQCTHWDKLSN